mmetsp:Transcript_44932/g.62473  ORF Transcript_44932/g.62473 Transcript_44932/m.62473 type:complete len:188 (+) Transcript_44932:82-645(+)
MSMFSLVNRSVRVCRSVGTASLQTSAQSLGILKGLNPILTPDLLWMLRAAGHGDEIVVVDANFPAQEVSTKCTTGMKIELAGITLPEALNAICEVYPLDFFISEPARYMSPTEGSLPPLGQEVIDASRAVIGNHADGITISPLERFEFYDVARRGFAVVQCVAERRPYGNFILTKGVVGPDGNDLKP